MPNFDNYSASLAIYRRCDLDLTETAVAQAILSFRNSDDGRCNPSVFSEDPRKETICTRSKASRRCVLATLPKLQAKGVLRVEKLSGRSSQYTFFDSAPDAPVQGAHQCATCTQPVQEVHRTRAPEAPYPCTTRTRNKEGTEKEQRKNQSVDDSSFSLSAEPMAPTPADKDGQIELKALQGKGIQPADTPARKPKHKAVTNVFDLAELPAEWRTLCEEIRPDLDPARVFTEFKFYWTQGRGQGTRRSGKGWTTTWMNWIKRQKEQRVQRPTYYPTNKAPVPEIPFEERDYGEGINDDHSF